MKRKRGLRKLKRREEKRERERERERERITIPPFLDHKLF
jgi:hypothetical protein